MTTSWEENKQQLQGNRWTAEEYRDGFGQITFKSRIGKCSGYEFPTPKVDPLSKLGGREKVASEYSGQHESCINESKQLLEIVEGSLENWTAAEKKEYGNR